MKRQRPQWTQALSPDLARYMHQDLVMFGVLTPSLLLAWHQTCKLFYKDWRNEAYLQTLLEKALAVARSRWAQGPMYASRLLDLQRLDMTSLSFRLGHVMTQMVPPDWIDGMQLDGYIGQRYHNTDLRVRHLVDAIGDRRAKACREEVVPHRLALAFRRAVKYLHRHTGWRMVTLSRPETKGGGFALKTTDRDVHFESECFRFDDEIVVTADSTCIL